MYFSSTISIRDCRYTRFSDDTLLCELLHSLEGLKMNFSLAHAMLKPGKSSLLHYLKESIEVYYILDGEGLMDINKTKKKVRLRGVLFSSCRGQRSISRILAVLYFPFYVFPTWQIRR